MVYQMKALEVSGVSASQFVYNKNSALWNKKGFKSVGRILVSEKKQKMSTETEAR